MRTTAVIFVLVAAVLANDGPAPKDPKARWYSSAGHRFVKREGMMNMVAATGNTNGPTIEGC